MNAKAIQLENISKSFGDQLVLNNIHLYIKKNEFLTLLGPSGCGKTTMLRIIGGFETPDSGDVLCEGLNITKLPPYKRHINTVFQKYALFTHLNVAENIAFGLKIQKMSKTKIEEKVKWALKLVNLEGYGNRYVDELSGGQQQRIAIARAIVNEPDILLLDEPLGALDLKLRKEMQYELKKLQQELGITFIYVTHDQEEALTMSDTVVVMNNGIIQQIGRPEDVYNDPANAFVADFIGESNILEGIMKKDCLVNLLGKDLECVDVGFELNEKIDAVIRPEDIVLSSPPEGHFTGVVTATIFKGVHYEMVVLANDYEWLVQSTTAHNVGEEVGLFFIPFNIHIMKKVVSA